MSKEEVLSFLQSLQLEPRFEEWHTNGIATKVFSLARYCPYKELQHLAWKLSLLYMKWNCKRMNDKETKHMIEEINELLADINQLK